MKTISIISTYPQNGSQNIGDFLITQCTKDIIQDTYPNEEIKFHILWRASQWDEIKKRIEESDFIIFACLAIRPNMSIIEYPALKEILSSNIPYGILSAGTSINYNYANNIVDQFSNEVIKILKKINDEAVFFNTRGVLSQYVCSKMELNNVTFAGDIAFYDKRFIKKSFKPVQQISKIAISDPHNSKLFLNPLKQLFSGLKGLFPRSEIHILLHGHNPKVEGFCLNNNITCKSLFKNPDESLDEYDNYDIHVGFRVHAHISMLKRKKPSYLLEQDGRGIDYGLTLDKKISVNCSPYYSEIVGLRNLIRRIFKRKYHKRPIISRSNIDFLLSIISHDLKNNFSKFISLENQMETFNKNILQDIKMIF
ncbi:MAG: polysaccharide pyruvyl transferase family protein [bacterium]